MSRTVNIYVKKQLRLDRLTLPQRAMYNLGAIALNSIRQRVARAHDLNDAPAPPLKSKSWIRIKKARGLRPIRDLCGTGMMSTGTIAQYRRRTLKRKSKLKSVGHLMDQIAVRKVSDNMAWITEPPTDAGRIKARGNREMLGFSRSNIAVVLRNGQVLLNQLKDRLLRIA